MITQNNKITILDGTTEEILGGVLDFDGLGIDCFMGFLDSDQQDTKKMNLEGTGSVTEENLSVIHSGVGVDDNLDETTEEYLGGDFCIDQLGGGVLDFYAFDIDCFLGCLDTHQEDTNKMNLEGTSREEILSVIDSGVGGVDDNLDETGTLTAETLVVMDSCFGDCCAAAQWKDGVQDLADLRGGDLCFDDSDIDWFMGYMDSESFEDSAINKLGRRKFGIGDQELVEFGGGSCLDDLGVFDIDWCLASDQEEAPIESSTANKLDKRKYEPEFGGGDDLGGGDLCSDDLGYSDVDWLIRCLDSNQEEKPDKDSTANKLEKRKYEAELGGDFCVGDFDVDWFMRLLDSNQEEEPVEHSTVSKLRKRKFQGEENSCLTKKMRL